MWKDLADGDEDFQNEVARVFDNTDVTEDDDWFTPDSYDNYVNKELALDQGGEQPEYDPMPVPFLCSYHKILE